MAANAQSGVFSDPARRVILRATEDDMPLPHFLILILAVILNTYIRRIITGER